MGVMKRVSEIWRNSSGSYSYQDDEGDSLHSRYSYQDDEGDSLHSLSGHSNTSGFNDVPAPSNSWSEANQIKAALDAELKANQIKAALDAELKSERPGHSSTHNSRRRNHSGSKRRSSSRNSSTAQTPWYSPSSLQSPQASPQGHPSSNTQVFDQFGSEQLPNLLGMRSSSAHQPFGSGESFGSPGGWDSWPPSQQMPPQSMRSSQLQRKQQQAAPQPVEGQPRAFPEQSLQTQAQSQQLQPLQQPQLQQQPLQTDQYQQQPPHPQVQSQTVVQAQPLMQSQQQLSQTRPQQSSMQLPPSAELQQQPPTQQHLQQSSAQSPHQATAQSQQSPQQQPPQPTPQQQTQLQTLHQPPDQQQPPGRLVAQGFLEAPQQSAVEALDLSDAESLRLGPGTSRSAHKVGAGASSSRTDGAARKKGMAPASAMSLQQQHTNSVSQSYVAPTSDVNNINSVETPEQHQRHAAANALSTVCAAPSSTEFNSNSKFNSSSVESPNEPTAPGQFDEAILAALVALPMQSLVDVLRKLAKRRPMEVALAFGHNQMQGHTETDTLVPSAEQPSSKQHATIAQERQVDAMPLAITNGNMEQEPTGLGITHRSRHGSTDQFSFRGTASNDGPAEGGFSLLANQGQYSTDSSEDEASMIHRGQLSQPSLVSMSQPAPQSSSMSMAASSSLPMSSNVPAPQWSSAPVGTASAPVQASVVSAHVATPASSVASAAVPLQASEVAMPAAMPSASVSTGPVASGAGGWPDPAFNSTSSWPATQSWPIAQSWPAASWPSSGPSTPPGSAVMQPDLLTF